jgi:transposase
MSIGMESAHSDSSEEIAMLRQMLTERDAALASATIEIEHLKLQLKALKRSQFGRSSEKLDAEIDQLELRLEDLEENEAERTATITTKG